MWAGCETPGNARCSRASSNARSRRCNRNSAPASASWRPGWGRRRSNSCPASPDPELVDERSRHGVVLVVAGAAGDEVGLVGGDGGQPDREVGELLVEPGPPGRGGGRWFAVARRGRLAFPGRVAELTGVGGGLPVARGKVAAGELADEVVGGGVVGAPAAVDDLGVVAGVVGWDGKHLTRRDSAEPGALSAWCPRRTVGPCSVMSCSRPGNGCQTVPSPIPNAPWPMPGSWTGCSNACGWRPGRGQTGRRRLSCSGTRGLAAVTGWWCPTCPPCGAHARSRWWASSVISGRA